MIPVISKNDTKTKFETIYVATTEDRSIAFPGQNYRKLDEVSDIHQMKFIGYNAGPDHSIYDKSMPIIAHGEVYSCLSEGSIRAQSIKKLNKRFIKNHHKNLLIKFFHGIKAILKNMTLKTMMCLKKIG